jgi:hypothetical protein
VVCLLPSWVLELSSLQELLPLLFGHFNPHPINHLPDLDPCLDLLSSNPLAKRSQHSTFGKVFDHAVPANKSFGLAEGPRDDPSSGFGKRSETKAIKEVGRGWMDRAGVVSS